MTIETFTHIINQLLPEPHAGLLSGILFGTKATLSPALQEALIRTGTLHIVALSGMNITILTHIIELICSRFLSRKMSSLLTIFIIIGFILFIGPSPSSIRAAIMGCLGMLAVVFGKQKWPFFTLVLAIVVMLLLNPLWAGDISFQLSVGATLGILLFAKKNTHKPETSIEIPTNEMRQNTVQFKEIVRWGWSLIEDDLRVTLSAQVFTIPLIFYYFHRISLISPLSNILIGFLIAPLTMLGFLMILGGILFFPLGQFFSWGIWIGLSYCILCIELTSKIPFASIGF